MNKIQDSFLIQDLEILSGVKAHTIRIWEKRYDLLNPIRLNRNIRKYSLKDLQKLLNISVLYNRGYKISKLSKLSELELTEEARKISLDSVANNFHLNSLLVGMYSFDTAVFEKVYNDLISKKTFKEIFIEVYCPLLNHMGVLWQTDAIKPAHEHFISNLIIEKIALNAAGIKKSTDTKKIYVLFLPEGELHSLGLMFLNYCLKLAGLNTLFIGGVPFSNLEFISNQFQDIEWICSAVIDKTEEEKKEFINKLAALLEATNSKCNLIGSIWKKEDLVHAKNRISLYSSASELEIN